jgi:hypothetical protein
MYKPWFYSTLLLLTECQLHGHNLFFKTIDECSEIVGTSQAYQPLALPGPVYKSAVASSYILLQHVQPELSTCILTFYSSCKCLSTFLYETSVISHAWCSTCPLDGALMIFYNRYHRAGTWWTWFFCQQFPEIDKISIEVPSITTKYANKAYFVTCRYM